MQTRSRNKVLLFGLLALALLLATGGGAFLLLRTNQEPRPEISPSGPITTEASPIKAEAGDTVVTLTWQPVRDATGYFVHRGGRDPLNSKPVTETRYIDIGLTNGRVYTYTVAPVIAGVEGRSLPPVQIAPISPR